MENGEFGYLFGIRAEGKGQREKGKGISEGVEVLGLGRLLLYFKF